MKKRDLLLLLLLLLAFAAALGFMRTRVDQSGSGSSPEIVSFTAWPRVVGPGDTVTLTWVTRGAPSVAISWGPERRSNASAEKRAELPPSGSLQVQPKENTVYVLECETNLGRMCMSASTTVRMK